MGILDRIKRRLPILNSPAPRPVYTPTRVSVPEAGEEEPEEERSPRGGTPVAEFIAAQVQQHPVLLFMKGSPTAPQCGFSANAAGILASYGVPVAHVNVLADPEVREGVKAFTNWPTIPQVFIRGEFIGGADILREMHTSGELKTLLASVAAPAQ